MPFKWTLKNSNADDCTSSQFRLFFIFLVFFFFLWKPLWGQQRCWRLENTGEPGRNPHRHMENIYYTIIGLYDMGLCNNYGVVHKLWSCVTVTRLCNHLRWNTVVLTQMMTLHVMYVCKFVIEYIVCNCVCCRSKRWAQEKFFQSVYLLLYYVQKLHSAHMDHSITPPWCIAWRNKTRKYPQHSPFCYCVLPGINLNNPILVIKGTVKDFQVKTLFNTWCRLFPHNPSSLKEILNLLREQNSGLCIAPWFL